MLEVGMSNFSGKTAFITGASRGIGSATAKLLSNQGANLCLFARSSHALEKLQTEMGTKTIIYPGDVSNYSDIEAAMTKTMENFGSLDILVNNAGVITPISSLGKKNAASWSKSIDINLKGVFYCMNIALDIMLANGSGSIISVSSGAAHQPVEGWSQYCAAKAGAFMLTRCLHLEFQNLGIRALSLSPGTVATQMQKIIKESGINPVSQLNWSDHVPPEWPAKAISWMCTKEADQYLGQEISLRDTNIRKIIGLE